MTYKSKSDYELKFLSENDFEIFCSDYNDTFGVKHQLEKAESIDNVAIVEVVDVKYLSKIIGKTTNKLNLKLLLDNWFVSLNKREVSTFKEF